MMIVNVYKHKHTIDKGTQREVRKELCNAVKFGVYCRAIHTTSMMHKQH